MSENHEEKLAVHDNAIMDIRRDIGDIKGTQSKILDSFHKHELDSEKYRVLLDEVIEEKKIKTAERQAIINKLVVSGVWGTVVLLLTLAWQGLKGKVGG